MKYVHLLFFFLWLAGQAGAQPAGSGEVRIGRYLDSIRGQEALLTAFFTSMPKGGDLHHHFSGSVYGETYLATIERGDYWIHTGTLAISPGKPNRKRRFWSRVSELRRDGQYAVLRRRLLERWSVLDYTQHRRVPPDEQFFGAFPAFSPAVRPSIAEGLSRLRSRAILENVQYIETMLTGVTCRPELPAPADNINAVMGYIQERRDEEGLRQMLDILMSDLREAGFERCAGQYSDWVGQLHDSLGLDDEQFVMRYQTYVVRVVPPARVFADLALCFEAAARSPLIVGVNIVAPEHDPVAIRDYWLHMQMYRYLSEKYPQVRKALHAGELVLGQVPPEELSWHIRAAVEIAGAHRIGHGIDLPHETDWQGLLTRLRELDVAVEINLSSNAFILGVEGDEHPLRLYRRAGVPLVISTDDAGVLRGNLSEQFVRLTRDYPDVSYAEIKRYVYNSIRYSFIENPDDKETLRRRLDELFLAFESRMLAWMGNGEK